MNPSARAAGRSQVRRIAHSIRPPPPSFQDLLQFGAHNPSSPEAFAAAAFVDKLSFGFCAMPAVTRGAKHCYTCASSTPSPTSPPPHPHTPTSPPSHPHPIPIPPCRFHIHPLVPLPPHPHTIIPTLAHPHRTVLPPPRPHPATPPLPRVTPPTTEAGLLHDGGVGHHPGRGRDAVA